MSFYLALGLCVTVQGIPLLIQVHLDRNVLEEAVLEEAEFYNVAGS